jgi:hypothetical protein
MELPQDLTIIDKAKGFATSMTNWAAKDVFGRVSDEVFAQRKAICMECPFWDAAGFNNIGKCKICGCSAFKLYIPSDKCPAQPPKWTATSAADTSHSRPA